MYYTFYICVDLLYTNEVLLHFDLSWHIYSGFSIEEKFEGTSYVPWLVPRLNRLRQTIVNLVK